MKKIRSGYTKRGDYVYKFSHIDIKNADRLKDMSSYPYVVVTINRTIVHDDPNQVHHNVYFASGLIDAIKLAMNITLESFEVPEKVVDLRMATVEEENRFRKACEELESTGQSAIQNDS